MSREIITTNEFWNMLKEAQIIPHDLDHVIRFDISGDPNGALLIHIIKLVEEEDAKDLVELLEGYVLEKKEVRHTSKEQDDTTIR